MSLKSGAAGGAIALALLVSLGAPAGRASEVSPVEGYREVARKIIEAARADHFAWHRLAELSDSFGPRLSGSSLPLMSPLVDGSRYFLYHHTQADTVERLDPEEVAGCVAGIAVMAFVVADLPLRLGH